MHCCHITDVSVVVLLWLGCWLAAPSSCQLLGHIGTLTNESVDYTPTSDGARFFLNARDPANADGIITKVRYCFIRDRNMATRLFQATVGFYRKEGDRFHLTSSFNVTKNYSVLTDIEDKLQCETLSVPKTEIHQDEMIGVCSRFFDKSIGRIIFVADTNKSADTLFQNGVDDRESFCYMEGSVPMEFVADQLEEVSGHLLLLYANITAKSFSFTTPTPDRTTELSNSNVTLSDPAKYGIIAACIFVLLSCTLACIACLCCICCKKKGRHDETSGNSGIVITNPSSYYLYENFKSGGKVKPHMIGPENLTSSTLSASYEPPIIATHRSPAANTEMRSLDATLVQYTEVVDKKETGMASTGEHLFDMPESKNEDDYAQLEHSGAKTIKWTEIEEVDGKLGQGTWKPAGKNVVEVHLKKAKDEEEKTSSLQEAATLAQFRHPNIITFYGVLVDTFQVTIVEELLCGHLKPFLGRLRSSKPGHDVSRNTPKILLNFSQQVALGMKYLSEKGFVHGKVMASSIMLSRANVCKITDFGWSRDITYGMMHKMDIPAKWNAPEVISYHKFSCASDVWSYGCLLYEIWSLGRDPMEGEDGINVMKLLNAGWRLAPPPGCPKVIYELMMESWSPEVEGRPSFAQLVMDLTRLEALVLNIPQKLLDQYPHCAQLGAPLSVGKLMYRNVQIMYRKSTQPAE